MAYERELGRKQDITTEDARAEQRVAQRAATSGGSSVSSQRFQLRTLLHGCLSWSIKGGQSIFAGNNRPITLTEAVGELEELIFLEGGKGLLSALLAVLDCFDFGWRRERIAVASEEEEIGGGDASLLLQFLLSKYFIEADASDRVVGVLAVALEEFFGRERRPADDFGLLDVCRVCGLSERPKSVAVLALAFYSGSEYSAWKGEGARFLSTLDQYLGGCGEQCGGAPIVFHPRLREALESGKSKSASDLRSGLLSGPLQRSLFATAGERKTLEEENADTLFTIIDNRSAAMANSGRRGEVYDLMKDIGYMTTASRDNLIAVFSLVPRDESIEDQQQLIARIIAMVCKTHHGLVGSGRLSMLAESHGLNASALTDPAQPMSTWNVDVLVEVVREIMPSACNMGIVSMFDFPGFSIGDQQETMLLLHLVKSIAPNEPFPVMELCGRVWNERKGQLSFLHFAVLAPPEIFSFVGATPRQIEPLDGLHGGKLAMGAANGAWISLDLILVLCELADIGYEMEVRKILEWPLNSCQEVLLVGLVQCRKPRVGLQQMMVVALVQFFLGGQPNSALVLTRVWQSQPDAVVEGMTTLYNADNAFASRALEVAQELKVLSELLTLGQPPFVLELAALAARREYLNIEKWLQNSLRERDASFIGTCIEFLRSKLERQGDRRVGVTINLAPEIAMLIFSVLEKNSEPHALDELRALFTVPAQAGARVPQTGEEPASTFPPEIEAESNQLFAKLYNGEQSIDGFMGLMRNLSISQMQRERSIYACVGKSLVDEAEFYPDYPDKQLHITGVLLGQLIQQNLIVDEILTGALENILDALRNPPKSRIFIFGATAIDQFQQRLSQLHSYCRHLARIPHIRAIPGNVPAIIEHTISSMPELDGTQGQAFMDKSAMPKGAKVMGMDGAGMEVPRQGDPGSVGPLRDTMMPIGMSASDAGKDAKDVADLAKATASMKLDAARQQAPSFATQLNIDTLIAANPDPDIVYPGEEVEGQVHFIMNNLSLPQIKEKEAELFKHMTFPLHRPWFANYMVIRRASIEPNFHKLYLGLLAEIDDQILYRLIVRQTIGNVSVLLRGDKIKTNSSERSLLKNLGSWLGQLTLARNKPLLQKDVDIKKLIYDAFQRGKMIAVIPFVAKILEHGKASKVFSLPNPWTTAVLALLTEIYYVKDLKLNLKFEIEMLFKQFEIEVGKIAPSESLASYGRESENNPDFTVDKSAMKAGYAGAQKFALPNQQGGGQAAGWAPMQQQQQQQQPGGFMPQVQQPRGGMRPMMGEEGSEYDHASGAAFAASSAPNVPPQSQPEQPSLQTYITINISIAKMAEKGGINMKRLITLAIDKVIREILPHVWERCVRLAMITTRELITKDFQMEPDAEKMRKAAQTMVTSLVSSYSTVQFREQLFTNTKSQLKDLLVASKVPYERVTIEDIAATAANDNLDLCCALVERAAAERGMQQVDDALAPQYAMRRKHMERTGNPNFDMREVHELTFPSSVPETLAPKPCSLSPLQQRVYEEFSKSPRIWPRILQQHQAAENQRAAGMAAGPNQTGQGGVSHMDSAQGYGEMGHVAPPFAAGDIDAQQRQTMRHQQQQSDSGFLEGPVLEKVKEALARLDGALKKEAVVVDYGSLPQESDIRLAVHELVEAVAAERRLDTGFAVAQVLVKWLYDGSSSRLGISTVMVVLERMKPLCQNLPKDLTQWLFVSLDDEYFLSQRELAVSLVRAGLIPAVDIDMLLSTLLTRGKLMGPVTDMATHLVRQLVLVEDAIPPGDFASIIDILCKLATRPGVPEAFVHLAEQARSKLLSTGPSRDGERQLAGHGGPRSEMGPRYPPGIREQVATLFEEWIRIVESSPSASDKSVQNFFMKMQQAGFLQMLSSSDADQAELLFRMLTEMAIAHSLNSDAGTNASGVPSPLSFMAIDAYIKMVVCMSHFVAESLGIVRTQLFRHVVVVTVKCLQRDAEDRGPNFNARPWCRLMLGWIVEFGVDTEALKGQEVSNQQLNIYGHYVQNLRNIQPLRVPAFSFAWLELMSHRSLMPKLLLVPGQKLWPLVLELLLCMLRFLEPFLRNVELTDSTRLLYKGTMRVILVLLHDFPEFLCENHIALCDVIPSSCIQLRNVILSAYPSNMRLPDPFAPNLKMDLLPEILQPPRISHNTAAKLNPVIGTSIDKFLRSRNQADVAEIRPRLYLNAQDSVVQGTRYNVSQINLMVLYIGLIAIKQQAQLETTAVAKSLPMELIQYLISDLDSEGRYLFINAIVNQLRYPNNHTHYFNSVLLHLFSESHNVVQELITRVLLERLIVSRPHPWGLLITFIELIKNPRYNFWQHNYSSLAPEIEHLFESVSRACMQQKDSEVSQNAIAAEIKM